MKVALVYKFVTLLMILQSLGSTIMKMTSLINLFHQGLYLRFSADESDLLGDRL